METRVLSAAAIAVAIYVAVPGQTQGAWLRYYDIGTTQAGPREFVTTIAQVWPLPPSALQAFEIRLATYSRRVEPGIANVRSRCIASDDQVAASVAADHFRNNEARRIGWEHLSVVAPSDWLPASEDGGDIYHP